MKTRARKSVVSNSPPPRGAADAVFYKYQLNVADVSFGESGGAICQIVVPHPNEAIVKAQLPYVRQSFVEAVAPGLQRMDVVRTDVFRFTHRQVGCPGN